MTGRNILKQWFSTAKKPLQGQFAEWIDSFWHKGEDTIQISDVNGLPGALAGKAATSVLSTKADVTYVNTQDQAEVTARQAGDVALQANINNKVDKVAGFGLSSNDYTSAEKTKLANMAEHFVGVFVSEAALVAAKPVGIDGQYGVVESVGVDAVQYIWDTANNEWVPAGTGGGSVASVNGQTGAVSLSTDDIGEGASHKYFTEARALVSVLTGISFLTAGSVLPTDTILQAIGKLQAQITAPNGILTGLAVSIAAQNLTVGIGTWRIDNAIYQTTVPTIIVIADPDLTNNRIDLVYGNDSNQILVLEGTASANPVKPSVPASCIEIGFVLVSLAGNSTGSAPTADYVTQSDFDNTVGDKTELITGERNNLVDAINEVKGEISAINQDNVILNIFKKSNYS